MYLILYMQHVQMQLVFLKADSYFKIPYVELIFIIISNCAGFYVRGKSKVLEKTQNFQALIFSGPASQQSSMIAVEEQQYQQHCSPSSGPTVLTLPCEWYA